MMIYPAVDIKDGKCVRLRQGRYDDMTVFGDDPVEAALHWESLGARYLHVVDLDGARGKGASNRAIIGRIIKKLGIPVQTGGGIRTMADIDEILDLGAGRVILGTAAIADPDIVPEAVDRYRDRIAVGIDARDGMAAIQGWESSSGISALEFAGRMASCGVKTIIYTDISTDGMLSGPNLNAMREMKDAVPCDVIASGGVGSIGDLLNLKRLGVAGAITGKAIYTGAIDLGKAVEIIDSTFPRSL